MPAAKRVYALDPHVRFRARHAIEGRQRHVADRAPLDLVLDGSDNFETRYLVSDACFLSARPLITASAGTSSTARSPRSARSKNEKGELDPTYRCLFPEPPPPGTVPTCAEAGVLGALAGVLGSMMAMEAIREIVGFGEGLVSMMVDARSMRFETLRYARDSIRSTAMH